VLRPWDSGAGGSWQATSWPRRARTGPAPSPSTASTGKAHFKAVFNSLEPYRTDGGFVSYTELTKADTRKLAREIDALAEELSQVPAEIASSE